MASLADEAIDLAALAGLWLDQWQQIALEDLCAVDAEDKWVTLESGVLVSRQNGKGGIIEALELAGLFLWDEKLILHSAHEFKTAQEAFLRIKDLIEGCEYLSRKVKRITTAHGEEGVTLMNGARLRFVARSKSSGRGFTADRSIFDEAQELPSLAITAMLPTLAAVPNPSVLYTGTVPSIENDAEHWTKIRDRGRSGADETLTWLEWSGGEDAIEETDLDDRETWRLANPAIGYRLTEKFIQAERNSLKDDGFARERLSIWPSSRTNAVIDKRLWKANLDATSQPVSPLVLAFDVTPGGALGSVSAAGWRADGLPHVEFIDRRAGSTWLVEGILFLAKTWDCIAVAYDSRSEAAGVGAELEAAGLKVLKMTTEDMLQGTLQWKNRIESGQVRHIGQKPLTDATTTATKRKVGTDGWLFNRAGNVDISPLVSGVIALHVLIGADAQPAEPVPNVRILRR